MSGIEEIETHGDPGIDADIPGEVGVTGGSGNLIFGPSEGQNPPGVDPTNTPRILTLDEMFPSEEETEEDKGNEEAGSQELGWNTEDIIFLTETIKTGWNKEFLSIITDTTGISSMDQLVIYISQVGKSNRGLLAEKLIEDTELNLYFHNKEKWRMFYRFYETYNMYTPAMTRENYDPKEGPG